MALYGHATPDLVDRVIDESCEENGWDRDDPEVQEAIDLIRDLIWLEAEGFVECQLDSTGEVRVYPLS